MKKNQTYRIGKRLLLFRNIFYLMATFVVVTFYFIYDYLNILPGLKGAPLVAVFILAEAVILVAANAWCRQVMAKSSYTLTDEALEITMGTNHQSLPWKDFTRAYYGMPDFTTKCPVFYEVKGRTFRPNQYLDEVWQMNREIVRRIEPYAEIEEGLMRKIEAFI